MVVMEAESSSSPVISPRRIAEPRLEGKSTALEFLLLTAEGSLDADIEGAEIFCMSVSEAILLKVLVLSLTEMA